MTVTHASASSGRAAHLPGLVAGLFGLALLVFQLVRFASLADDAYISFRYLDHWLAGDGLVWNPGERVEGYTNFLWIVLLLPLRALGMTAETASVGLSLAALALLLAAVWRGATVLAGDAVAGWTALTLAAGSAALASWSVSGMETTAFAALLALANERLISAGRLTLGAALFFGLAVLTRPDGALHAVAAFAAAALLAGGPRRAWRELWRPGLFFLVLPAGHLVFRLAYYGRPLPNTYYAKLSGELPSLVPGGLAYVGGFLAAGGAVLVLAAVPALARWRRWPVLALALQGALHLAWVVTVGGDYFPFHRFAVPVVPALAVLGGVSLTRLAPRRRAAMPFVALALSGLAVAAAHRSPSRAAFDAVTEVRAERRQVADWLAERLAPDALLAVNAAGVIPYRTGRRAIDMLGLSDRHIAAAPVAAADGDGWAKVGHFKHDGAYVCSRSPDAVLTSGGRLHRGRSAEEAILQAAVNSYPGDREFLRDPACAGLYQPLAEELLPGRWAVVYLRQDEAEVAPAPVARTAEEWFHHGVAMMQAARLEDAAAAFETSLELAPGHPAALTNLGFCRFDLGRPQAAIAAFEEALARDPRRFDALYGLAQSHQQLGHRDDAAALWRRYLAIAPESPWKERARQHLALLGQ